MNHINYESCAIKKLFNINVCQKIMGPYCATKEINRPSLFR